MRDPQAQDTLVPCFVCGKSLLRAFDTLEMQPSRGVMCYSHGNYGSRVFDPMHTTIVFLVCDECLTERRDRVRVSRQTRPETTYHDWTGDEA